MTKLRLWLLDTLERAGSTLVQTVIPLIILAMTSGSTDWSALTVAAFAAVGSVLLASVKQLSPAGLPYHLDVLVRLVRTLVVTGLSLALASGFDLYSAAAWQSVAVAVGVAALVFIKAEFAAWRSEFADGSALTAASLVVLVPPD